MVIAGFSLVSACLCSSLLVSFPPLLSHFPSIHVHHRELLSKDNSGGDGEEDEEDTTGGSSEETAEAVAAAAAADEAEKEAKKKLAMAELERLNKKAKVCVGVGMVEWPDKPVCSRLHSAP